MIEESLRGAALTYVAAVLRGHKESNGHGKAPCPLTIINGDGSPSFEWHRHYSHDF
ncbi:hypothetical protein [Vibrio parahaemolyticus]|uniref:hypothetical protein n=1 Tax=Vibrio parahaemolyticus TaxID=670 RepID=UPI000A5746DD|nr:hypothetical protein [Vibrio parahaemolyticus]